MTEHQRDEERIFHVARGLDNIDLRQEYLNQICEGDQALRERVESLLAVHEKEGTFLKSQAENESTVLYSGITETVGQKIGRYKLLQKIGEGGFGVVYMAEQSRPVRRKVALKVIKPGMDTSAVIARFEAERQALALMDHPGIAKVFDGGTTDSGRPYFVMELVKGVSVTEFCDENRLSVRQRLELFTTICRAIQHAHQKGVIHRDIKPSNVLVTLHDGQPVPKVIDFGVSKAISQQLTEKTLFTAHGQMIGTPQYMSPEQAEMSGLDIDTRSDIYSLGILLYELLTGFTPLDPEQIRSTAFAELQRLIREDEPVHPSRRCSTQGEQSATIAAKRRTDPRKLGLLLRGELDWIIMKTLEKDRNRRYESPNALAIDVENFLNDETVTACPPSIAYRFKKFSVRNKTLLLTGGAIALLLFASALSGWVLYGRAEKARQEALNARKEAENATGDANRERDHLRKALNDISDLQRQQTIEIVFSLAAFGQEHQAHQKIQEAEIDDKDRTVLTAMLHAEIESIHGNPLKAVRILEDLKTHENDVILQALLANAYFDAGNYWAYYRHPVVHGVLSPQTPYENLFVGKAMFWLDFKQSVTYLDEAVALTPSPLSLTYRARSLALQAASLRGLDVEQSLKLIDQAVDDAETALRLFRARSTGDDNHAISPAVQGTYLLILVHAYDIYKQEERHQEADEALKMASIHFDGISETDQLNSPYVRAWKGFYQQRKAVQLDEQEKYEQAEDAKRQAAELLGSTSYADFKQAADILKSDPIDKQGLEMKRRAALKTATDREDSARQNFVIALLHMMSEDTEAGRHKVNELIDLVKREPSIGEVLQICQIYILMGQLDDCREYATQQSVNENAIQGLPINKRGLAYFAAEINADEYLRSGESTGATTFRLLMVGLTELAKGNREIAKKRLRQVKRDGLFHAWEYVLALAISDRLERDASWPGWLPSDAVQSDDMPADQ